MRILLVDKDIEMVQAWFKYFNGAKDVEVIHGDYFSEKTDCIVSPANSFGFMDGGLDLVISKRFGWQLQKRVQEEINKEYGGELLVGQSFVINTKDVIIPYCLVAPTMRVPEFVPSSPNAYLAMKAILLELLHWKEVINTVTICGLCTGVGAMPQNLAAKQMYKAYQDFWLGEFTPPTSWLNAKNRHLELCGWAKRSEF